MDILKDILAALSGVLNGLPQGILAMSFGFATIPTALAFMTGVIGNSVVGSVAPISFQAETITLAGTMGKNMREQLSMIFFGASIMLTKVSLDMANKNKLVGYSSIAIALLAYMVTKDLVYAIAFSVFISSGIAFFQKRDVQLVSVEKEKFVLQKFIINPIVVRGALAMVTLNIGANIAFGQITGDIAGADVNIDHLTVISSLADMVSVMFGGGPVEAIISATAGAPHPVWSGVLMMAIMAVILLAGWLPKIGKYIPSESISGFLIVLGEAGGNIVAKAAILAEGDAAQRDDIIYLEPLPLFPVT